MDCSPSGLLCPWNSPDKNTGVGCQFLLQAIFPIQGLNLPLLCLLHWKMDSLTLSHLGSPFLSWTASYNHTVFCTERFNVKLTMTKSYIKTDLWPTTCNNLARKSGSQPVISQTCRKSNFYLQWQSRETNRNPYNNQLQMARIWWIIQTFLILPHNLPTGFPCQQLPIRAYLKPFFLSAPLSAFGIPISWRNFQFVVIYTMKGFA